MSGRSRLPALLGLPTVDDVIDVIREEAAEDIQAMGLGGADLDESYMTHIKARLPWLLLAASGGVICYFLLWTSLKPFEIDNILVNSICLLPLAFFIVSTLSSQTVTVLVGFLRTHGATTQKSWLDLKKEFFIGFSLMGFICLIFLIGSLITSGWIHVPMILAGVLGLQMLITILVSMGIPLFISRLNFDPIVSGPSISMILSNIFSVAVLVFYYAVW